MISGFHIILCPTTGMKVQTRVPRAEETSATERTYEMFSCPACTHTHLVEVRTGRVLGQPK